MKIVKAECPDCGGAIKVSEDISTAKCEHCGSSIILDWEGKTSLAVNLNLGKKYLAIGDFKNAEDSFRKALEKNPDNSDAWFWKGNCLLQSMNVKSLTDAPKILGCFSNCKYSKEDLVKRLGLSFLDSGNELAYRVVCKILAKLHEDALYQKNINKECLEVMDLVMRASNHLDSETKERIDDRYINEIERFYEIAARDSKYHKHGEFGKELDKIFNISRESSTDI